MSKYEYQYDDEKVICPYCQHSYRQDAGDFSEDDEVEECDNCGKQYHLYQEISITHNTKPDCELNNEAHDYKDERLSDGSTYPFCTVCGKIKPLGGGK